MRSERMTQIMKSEIFYTRFPKCGQETFLNIADKGAIFFIKYIGAVRVSRLSDQSGFHTFIDGHFPGFPFFVLYR